MTGEDKKIFMKDFFEKYYEKKRSVSEALVAGVKIPSEMVAYELPTSKGWQVWKLIPSTVTDNDIRGLEETLGVTLPECLRAFLTTYHHRFDGLIGRNDIGNPFKSIENAYNPHLVRNDYLPFGWDSDDYYLRCIDLSASADDEKCPVVQIDHETLFDITEEYEDEGKIIPKEELLPYIEEVSDNFYEYLNVVLNKEIE